MDWYSWLSKTSLDSSLVYDYGLAFAQNELEEDDIPYFNHEFLQSMGISIAKHRLEILKLARKEKGSSSNIPHHFSRILIKLKRTKRCFSKYLRAWIRHEESTLALVPRRSYSGRWKNSMMKRNRRSSSMVAPTKPQNRAAAVAPPPQLLLTNGSPAMSTLFASSRINSFSSPFVNDHDQKGGDGDYYDESWSSAVEEIRWDAMFQNLKPT